jgi:dTDP-4-amino-4,6-dideoxygalactose transaminase
MDIQIPRERKHEKVNWYLYTIATKNRDKILKKLNDNGIGAAVYYPIPVHKTPYYNNKTKLKITEWAASHVLSLPIQPKVMPQNLNFMAKIMRKALK